MSEGEKLHRLLEFMATTGQKSYTYEELIPAYKYGLFKQPNTTEIQRLCHILLTDELVTDGTQSGHPGITVKPAADAAYYSNKYFQPEEGRSGISVSVVQVLLFVGGVVVASAIWYFYMISDRNRRIDEAAAIDQTRLQQVEILSKKKDSLQNVVKNISAELAKAKKATAKPATPKKAVTKKKKR